MSRSGLPEVQTFVRTLHVVDGINTRHRRRECAWICTLAQIRWNGHDIAVIIIGANLNQLRLNKGLRLALAGCFSNINEPRSG